MRTTFRPAIAGSVSEFAESQGTVPLRRELIFSTEFVFGPARDVVNSILLSGEAIRHTNGSNDRSTTVVLRRDHLRVDLGEPLQLHTVVEMIEGGTGRHDEVSMRSKLN